MVYREVANKQMHEMFLGKSIFGELKEISEDACLD